MYDGDSVMHRRNIAGAKRITQVSCGGTYTPSRIYPRIYHANARLRE